MVAQQITSESLGSNPSKTTNLKLSNMDLTNFNAEQARKSQNKSMHGELTDILFKIYEEALKGGSCLFLKTHPNKFTLESLKSRGFEVRENLNRSRELIRSKPTFTYQIFW